MAKTLRLIVVLLVVAWLACSAEYRVFCADAAGAVEFATSTAPAGPATPTELTEPAKVAEPAGGSAISTAVLPAPTASTAPAASTMLPELAGADLSLREALRQTLERQPSVQIAKIDVALQETRLRQARAAFDQLLTLSLTDSIVRSPFSRLEKLAAGLGRAMTEKYVLDVSLSRQNRSGVKIIPSFQLSGTRNTPVGRSFDLLGLGELHFALIAPLARGRHNSLDAASERAVKFEIAASVEEQRFAISKAVYQTIIAYWGVLAAERRLQIQIMAEQRGKQRIENLKKLAAAEQIAAAQVVTVEADLAETQAQLLLIRQLLVDAKLTLGSAIGMSREEAINLGTLTTDWVAWADEDELPASLHAVDELITTALSRRSDLLALQARQRSAVTLLPALRSQTRPRIDLSLDVGYHGLVEGGAVIRPVEALLKNTSGLSSMVKLEYQFPLENQDAKGRLQQQEHSVNSIQVQVDDLARTITINIEAQTQKMARQFLAVKKLDATVAAYREAFHNEEKKQQLGLATVIDVLLMEDRMIAAALQKFDAQKELVSAFSRLQFECGGLVYSMGTDGVLSFEHFGQNPSFEQNTPFEQNPSFEQNTNELRSLPSPHHPWPSGNTP